MVQPAAISASAPNTNLLITQLHATAATTPGRDRFGYGTPLFSCKIYREF
jgi:hypothetical protein